MSQPIKKADIIFDCERMKHAHTGLYHFCLQLGNALLLNRKSMQHRLGFYLPSSESDLFGDNPFNKRQHSLHKYAMPFANQYKVWHGTYQDSNYFPLRSSAKKVLTIHDLNFLHENKPPEKVKKYTQKLQDKIDRADRIVTISNYVKNEIESTMHMGGKEVQVVYNGCNINEHINPIKPQFSTDNPFLFSIGTVAPKKNFHVLPAMLLQNDLDLIIAGTTTHKEYYQKVLNESKRLGVQNRVHLTGPITEAEKYWLLKNCDLFCFPSLAEGFGLPVIEAMHFGKNVVLSDATSLPEIGGPYAHYFNGFDPEQVSDLTTQILEQIDTKSESELIKEWSQQFNWRNTANEYWRIYEELLNE
ncbi:group 1 glycosyl transferase [Siphonobacter sp. BAB-5385]|nr:group 1 glycosyl transferase [Siphonobacter sp. BAB-5385]PMD93101.1 group 1 glycosyl transferase [Siphonobacter sp. BAB-5405]